MESRSVTTSALEAQPRVLPWGAIVFFGLLLIALFAETLRGMVIEWIDNEEMGHGLFVPFIAAYIIWQDRVRLLSLKLIPSWAGLAVVVLGFASMVIGIRGADFFISRMGFMVALVGVLLTLGGLTLIRALLFPLFVLLFMIRIPTFLYTQITFPLQLLASRVAESFLTLIGIPVLRDGNILELPSQRLSVVEACSGIRSLMSLSLLALAYGYAFDSKPWMRWALLALAAPIAIAVNALRVTGTGIMSEIDKSLASGPFHAAEGFIMWALALASLVAAHRLINWTVERWTRTPATAGGPAPIAKGESTL